MLIEDSEKLGHTVVKDFQLQLVTSHTFELSQLLYQLVQQGHDNLLNSNIYFYKVMNQLFMNCGRFPFQHPVYIDNFKNLNFVTKIVIKYKPILFMESVGGCRLTAPEIFD